MKAKREYRDRRQAEVQVLDALVDRSEEGMTVFELRSTAEADIDDLEAALSTLKEDDLITVEENGGRTVIIPAAEVVPDASDLEPDESLFEQLRRKLPF
jgi:hypothetical protein